VPKEHLENIVVNVRCQVGNKKLSQSDAIALCLALLDDKSRRDRGGIV